MQQIYKKTLMLKCGFNKVALLKSHFGTGVLLKNVVKTLLIIYQNKTKHTEK